MNTNKIENKTCYCKYIMLVLFSFSYVTISAQNPLNIINTKDKYQQQVQKDSLQTMVLLDQLIPSLQYDLRYASHNNFMHRQMYPKDVTYTFLRLPAAHALDSVQTGLAKQGLGIKVFDAYRPYAVTVNFWELVKDERYVANPKNGSGHNRGLAIDLTIINLTTGESLNMGTDFDNFSDTAHHTFTQLPDEVLNNRKLLKTTMEQYGFKALSTEWWHYAFPNTRNYDVLDISFNELKKLAKKRKK